VGTVALSAGTIEYEDSGGDGPAVVLLHGVLMGPQLWQSVADLLPGAGSSARPCRRVPTARR